MQDQYEFNHIDELIEDQGPAFWNTCDAVRQYQSEGFSTLRIAQMMSISPSVIRQINEHTRNRGEQ